MNHSPSRRHFFKSTGAVSAAAVLGSTAVLPACGSSGSDSVAPLNSAQQVDLTATQALAAMKAGTMTATAYITTLIARAKGLLDLNGMIFIDEAGALAAANK